MKVECVMVKKRGDHEYACFLVHRWCGVYRADAFRRIAGPYEPGYGLWRDGGTGVLIHPISAFTDASDAFVARENFRSEQ